LKAIQERYEPYLSLLLLELLSLSPILILLGNIVPPFPVKVHFIGFGLIFLLSLFFLALKAEKKWLIYLILLYGIYNFAIGEFHLKDFFDFFFGPMVLLCLFDILFNERLPPESTVKYQRRFYRLLWLPIIISTLQFFDIMPLTLWNATYINSSLIDGVWIPRPNGFLYHGSELAIILFFVALFQYFRSETSAFWTLLALILMAAMTYYKAITLSIFLLLLYFLAFINRGKLSQFSIISKKRLFAYGGLILFIAFIAAYLIFSTIYKHTGYYLPQQLLTGRGAIWNIYSDAIKDFAVHEYLLGNGIGSTYALFREYATPENYWPLSIYPKLKFAPDGHNALLNVFINTGILGLLFFAFLFKMVHTQIKRWPHYRKRHRYFYFAFFILPIISIGITIPIYDMAIFWCCLGFLLLEWRKFASSIDQ
jgi:hypothetical protein